MLADENKPCSINFWKRKLNTEIDKMNAIFQSTSETRLRVLHWKILHNMYPTNILLNKMGISNSDTCNACNSGARDFIEHVFFHCTKVKPIWGLVEKEI